MPDAYANYFVYALENSRAPSMSPATPGEQGNCFTYNLDHRIMSTAGSYSPSSMESPIMEEDLDDTMLDQRLLSMTMAMASDPTTETTTLEKPEIKIIVQPVDKFRFRYKSEMMGTHGSLLGEREESNHKKEVPTVQLINPGILKNAVIRCTLVTSEEDRRFPHAHHLVRKGENGNGDTDDPHDIEVSDDNNYTAMFCNMGIIHTAKKNIKEEILRKRKIEVIEEKKRKNYKNATVTTREEIEMKMEAEKAQKWMNLNSVALCFQGFSYGRNNVLFPITDKVYSRPINNLKSALTGELKICRIDKHCGSCEGHEEVFLLVEKVGKKNIKVKFYEMDESDNVLWDADGRFTELDVHHQYAIVFKTPPYKDTSITKPVEVLIKLERPSDGEISNSIKFVYKPSDKVLNRKRPRMSSSESMEMVQNVPNPGLVNPEMGNPSLGNCMPMAETIMTFGPDVISSLSGEIQKLLADDTDNNPQVLQEFLNDNPSLDKYFSLLPIQPINGFHVDGGVNYTKSQEDFTKDILKKVMCILKEIETNVGSKGAALNKVKNLLEESTSYGDTPLHFSLRHEQYESVKYILMILGSDPIFRSIVNLQNSSGKTPLHLAVIQNQSEVVRALLKLGADPNLCDEEDATSLHNAVIVEANACIDELLNSNANINLKAHTESGYSALHLAAKVGSLHAVKALLKAGADVNSTDMSYGRTALHFAVDSNHKHIVNYLVTETNIDVNIKNFGGNTALHNAVVKGGKCAEDLIKILKKHGADPKIRNNNVTTNQDDEEEDNGVLPPTETDMAADTEIKSENSDSEDDSTPGESSFDLAKDDPKLMQLLRGEQPLNAMQEELDLKEESEDEMTLQDRLLSQTRNASAQHRHSAPTPMTNIPPQKHIVRPDDEKLTDEHVNRVKHILDRTGGWERLANHTNHGSLVRLYRKTSSPSSALFVKIRLQNPDVTVRQVKKWLIDVEAFEAATALEPR